MATIGRDSADLLAGLQIDLLSKFRSGQVSADHLRWFLHLKKEQRDQLINTTKVEKSATRNILDPWSLIPGDDKDVCIVIQSIVGKELGRYSFAPPVSETIVYLVARTLEHIGLSKRINLGTNDDLHFDVVKWDPANSVLTVRFK